MRTADWKTAEDQVAASYKNAGWTILEKNYRRVGTELDLIAERTGTLAFIEIKLRRQESQLRLEELLPPRKKKAITRGARTYLAEFDPPAKTLRFDLVIIWEKEGKQQLEILENIDLQSE